MATSNHQKIVQKIRGYYFSGNYYVKFGHYQAKSHKKILEFC